MFIYYTSILSPIDPSSLLFPKLDFSPTDLGLVLPPQNLNIGGQRTIQPPYYLTSTPPTITPELVPPYHPPPPPHGPPEPVSTATIFKGGLQATLNERISDILVSV